MSTWTTGEKGAVASSASAAPSVHNTQPWLLQFHGGHGLSLYQRFDRPLPHHDPLGRDRLISCGAAVENLRLAMRILGWLPEIMLFPDRRHPDEVARIAAVDRHAPSVEDLARHAAIPARRSYREPFAAQADSAQRQRIVSASHTSGVQVRLVRDDETAVVARGLSHAALVLRADRAYQRELSAWTSCTRHPAPGDGVARAGRRQTLPWVGLVRRATPLPAAATIAVRLRPECLAVLETPDDGPADHVRAGMAAQSTWLAATVDGLVGAMLTQPIQLSEVRSGLIEGLALGGFPQALMRFGQPTEPVSNNVEER